MQAQEKRKILELGRLKRRWLNPRRFWLPAQNGTTYTHSNSRGSIQCSSAYGQRLSAYVKFGRDENPFQLTWPWLLHGRIRSASIDGETWRQKKDRANRCSVLLMFAEMQRNKFACGKKKPLHIYTYIYMYIIERIKDARIIFVTLQFYLIIVR